MFHHFVWNLNFYRSHGIRGDIIYIIIKGDAVFVQIEVFRRGNISGRAVTHILEPLLGAEYGVQAGKNIDATLKNWKQVEQEVKDDEHAQSLFDLLTDVDMDYNPTWPESRNRELISMGYNSKEIREMRQKLAGLEAPPFPRSLLSV